MRHKLWLGAAVVLFVFWALELAAWAGVVPVTRPPAYQLFLTPAIAMMALGQALRERAPRLSARLRVAFSALSGVAIVMRLATL